MTGVANGVPVCTLASPCPPGQVQTGTSNGVPVCGTSGGCPPGQVEIGRVNNQAVCTVPDVCPPGVATIGFSMRGVPICSRAWGCPANHYQTGVSNGLPVCQAWTGCPGGTVYRGSRYASTGMPICEPALPVCNSLQEMATDGTNFYCRDNLNARCRGQGGNAASNVTGWFPPVCAAAGDQACAMVPGCRRENFYLPNIAMCAWTCTL